MSYFIVMKSGDSSMTIRNYLYQEEYKYSEITNTDKSSRKLASIFLDIKKH